MDLLFLFVLVLLLARAVRALFAGQRVVLAAALPGKIVADAFVVVVFGLAVFLRRAMVSAPLLLFAGLALYLLLSALAKVGLCDEGLIYTGKTVPFSEMRGFYIERENEKECIVRIHTAMRDYTLKLTAQQKEPFVARMAAGNVRFDEGSAEEPAKESEEE